MRRSLVALALLVAPASAEPLAQDWLLATPMLDAPYVDMPGLASVPGALIATVTTSSAPEGSGAEQHVAIIRSTDNGVTWSAPIDIEAANVPETSWVIPYYDAANGRLYAFYVYNRENVRVIPYSSPSTLTSTRVDSIGRIAYRVSTDGGLTWGARRPVPPLTNRAIDSRNPFGGEHQLLWLFGSAWERNGQVYFGFSKMGTVTTSSAPPLFSDTEAFIMRADVGAAGLSNFTVLPGGTGAGIRAPTPFWGGAAVTITEEPAIIVHDNRLISAFSRTDRGRLAESWSTDGGATFTNDWARGADGSSTVYHPRGPAMTFELPDGRFLLLTYNNGELGFTGRNPIWYRIGTCFGDRIRWASPHALIFDQDMDTRIGYASAAVIGNELLIAASNKTSARLMRFPLGDF